MPATQYARADDGAYIAYQVVGDGPSPFDLILIPPWASHVELGWENPGWVAFYSRLCAFSRLILIDKRGTGLSDRRPATTYPERTVALVLQACWARGIKAPDDPCGWDQDVFDALIRRVEEERGQGIARLERYAASPGMAGALLRMAFEGDVRDVLGAVKVPTLVLHRAGDSVSPCSPSSTPRRGPRWRPRRPGAAGADGAHVRDTGTVDPPPDRGPRVAWSSRLVRGVASRSVLREAL
ncbi:MAG TPA: hypothetical protein VHL53_15970 [Acidimicrobiia bacterium]|nr:hypothetical protein [Acidimicrobiia bacterium]